MDSAPSWTSVSLLGKLASELLRRLGGQVDADFAHHLHHLWMDALRRCGTRRERFVTSFGGTLEQRRAHLRTPGVVETDE